MSLSELVVPVLLCFTACYALGKRVDVYTALTRGAEEGLNVLVHILPSLIALLTAVYMFRASGAMEYLGALLAPALERVGIPPEVAPLLFIRPISGSGALAVGSELMATYGPDSYIGRVAAVMLGSSETTFYTIAVYFGSVGIVKTRYTIPASLCADAVMFLTSAAAVRVLMGLRKRGQPTGCRLPYYIFVYNVCLHLLGLAQAEDRQAVGEHLTGRSSEQQTGVRHVVRLALDAAGVVEAVERAGEPHEIAVDIARVVVAGGHADLLAEVGKLLD